MPLFDVVGLERVAAALERIARALEGRGRRSLTGYEDPGSPDASAVSYHSIEDAIHDEREREAYAAATGVELASWEAIPRPLNPMKKEWSSQDGQEI